MIVVNSVLNNLFDVFSYVVYDKFSRDAIIIDPGSNYDDLELIIENNKLKLIAILLTHGHFDHIISCKYFQQKNVPIYISEDDVEMCKNDKFNASLLCGYVIEKFEPNFRISNLINKLVFGTITVEIVKTPGHSKGGLSYLIGNYIFTGDTMFNNGYGRYDLFGGDYNKLLNSIKIIESYLKKGYILMPGHNY